MGWSENRPHLLWYDVVIKFLCPYFLATIENGTCGLNFRTDRKSGQTIYFLANSNVREFFSTFKTADVSGANSLGLRRTVFPAAMAAANGPAHIV